MSAHASLGISGCLFFPISQKLGHALLHSLKSFLDLSNPQGYYFYLSLAGTMRNVGIGAEQSLDSRIDEWRRNENVNSTFSCNVVPIAACQSSTGVTDFYLSNLHVLARLPLMLTGTFAAMTIVKMVL
jgi:hypothetical protein